MSARHRMRRYVNTPLQHHVTGPFAWLALAALAWGSMCAARDAPPPAAPPRELVVTYVANEGFLVAAGERRVLIDALFRDGVTGYAVVPSQMRERVEQGLPPFDDVDLVLATHHHADHFDPGAVTRHLKRNPRALFVSTPQAVARLEANAALAPEVRERVHAVLPEEGRRARVSYAGIDLDVLNLHHGRTRPIENLGFLIELDDRKLLHLGDTMAGAAEIAQYGLSAESIDVAFVPFWYLIDVDGKRAVREAIGAAALVVMHVPPPGSPDRYLRFAGGRPAMLEQIGREFPNAVVLSSEEPTRVFSSKR